MHQCCFVQRDNLNLGNRFSVLKSNYRGNKESADDHCDIRGSWAAENTDTFPVSRQGCWQGPTEILYPCA